MSAGDLERLGLVDPIPLEPWEEALLTPDRSVVHTAFVVPGYRVHPRHVLVDPDGAPTYKFDSGMFADQGAHRAYVGARREHDGIGGTTYRD